MSRVHKVQKGDSVASLAEASGHFPDTLWTHPNNKALRAQRSNMNILAEGDLVFVPDLRMKSLPAATGRVHRYRRRGVPAVFRLQLLCDGQPRTDVPYRIEIAGAVLSEGATDARGVLEAFVPPGTRKIELYLDESDEAHVFQVGHLQPVDHITGAQQRLRNLGHDCPESGAFDGPTRGALLAFQREVGLEETGELDTVTLEALRQAHDEVGGMRR